MTPDIYAVGDCALVTNRITGQRQWSAMGSTANIAGRLAAVRLAGEGGPAYPGVLGTGVAKLPGVSMGRTGLTEAAAKKAGFDVETIVAAVDDKAHYYPGSEKMMIKLICDRGTHKLLGMQALGNGAVDKMTDIAVTAISMGASLEDLQNCDFAYAPPFSTASIPSSVAVNALLNKLSGKLESFTPAQYAAGEAEGYTVLDVAIQPVLKDAPYIQLNQVNGPLEGHPLDEKLSAGVLHRQADLSAPEPPEALWLYQHPHSGGRRAVQHPASGLRMLLYQLMPIKNRGGIV